MILAVFELTSWSELAAMCGLIAMVSGLLGGIGLLWLNSRFASKKLHYREKDAIWVKLSEVEAKADRLDRESELAKQPIKTMETAVKEMKVELSALVASIGAMDKSVTAAINTINTRVTVLEDRPARRKS